MDMELRKRESLDLFKQILLEGCVGIDDAIYSVDYETEALQLIVKDDSCDRWENALTNSDFRIRDKKLNFTKLESDLKIAINLIRVEEHYFSTLLKFSGDFVWPGLNVRIARPTNPTDLYQLSVCFLPIWHSDPKFWEEWMRDKCDEEFKL